ncbi:MAG TPA: ATPase, partial [Gammaproteobacteria bacterium]|nr:ATPase [Gammaproteobacteria bacterium]
IDWARTLVLLHAEALDANMVRDTLNVILKFQEDIENVKGEVSAITAKVAR